MACTEALEEALKCSVRDFLACLFVDACSEPLRVVPYNILYHASGREHLLLPSAVLHVHNQVTRKRNAFRPSLPERAPSLRPTKSQGGLLLAVIVAKRRSRDAEALRCISLGKVAKQIISRLLRCVLHPLLLIAQHRASALFLRIVSITQ